MNTEQETNNEDLTFEEKIEIYDKCLEKYDLNSYKEISKIPLLTKEEQCHISQKIEDGEEIYKEYFIIANLRLARKIAHDVHRYSNHFHDLDENDLMQEGIIGLITAVDKFDYKQGYTFSTYATYWIYQRVSRSIENQGKSIRLPVHFASKIRNYKNAFEELLTQSGDEPNIESIAKKMGNTVDEILEIQEVLKRNIIPLEKEIFAEESEGFLVDVIADENALNPEKEAIKNSNSTELLSLVEKLPERERGIIKARFGLNGHYPKSLAEIGKEMGLTRERIRQIEGRGFKMIQRILFKEEKDEIINLLENLNEEERELMKLRFGLTRNKNSKKIIHEINSKDFKRIEEQAFRKILTSYSESIS